MFILNNYFKNFRFLLIFLFIEFKQKCFAKQQSLLTNQFIVFATLQTFSETYSLENKKFTKMTSNFTKKKHRHRYHPNLNENKQRVWQLYNHCSGGFVQSILGFANAKGRSIDKCLSIYFIKFNFFS